MILARDLDTPSHRLENRLDGDSGLLTIFPAFEPDLRPTLYVGAMRRNHLIAAASICFALIVYATLARLAGRPALMGHHEAYWVVVIERFSAYGLLGFLLSFLLPGRFALACSLVIGVAMGLELMQAFIPDRDPGFLDVLQKAAGGTVGVMLAQMILAFLPRPPS
ncbi:VanZ family protein [Bradyrhizobium sp. 5.13L]